MADRPELDYVDVAYRTLDDAARQGLIAALRGTGDGMEQGGLVFFDPKTGTYYRTPMVQGDGHDNIAVTGRRRSKGDDLAGWYHTHDSHDSRGEFSPHDIFSTRMSGVPAFMATARDQKARVYDPMVDKERRSMRSVKSTQPQRGRPFMDGARMVPEQEAIVALLRAENGN